MGGARPGIPRQLALRLDRLSVAAHRFHRLAHHPLCAEYEHEVIRVGKKTRICKGCFLAALGTTLGVALGASIPRLPFAALAALALGCGGLLAVAFPFPLARQSGPAPTEGSQEAADLSQNHQIPRPRNKFATRLLPFFFLAFTMAQCLRFGGARGWTCAMACAVEFALMLWAYRRRGPNRGPCLTCPERFQMHRCRGVKPILARERAFQRLAGRMIQKEMAQ